MNYIETVFKSFSVPIDKGSFSIDTYIRSNAIALRDSERAPFMGSVFLFKLFTQEGALSPIVKNLGLTEIIVFFKELEHKIKYAKGFIGVIEKLRDFSILGINLDPRNAVFNPPLINVLMAHFSTRHASYDALLKASATTGWSNGASFSHNGKNYTVKSKLGEIVLIDSKNNYCMTITNDVFLGTTIIYRGIELHDNRALKSVAFLL